MEKRKLKKLVKKLRYERDYWNRQVAKLLRLLQEEWLQGDCKDEKEK